MYVHVLCVCLFVSDEAPSSLSRKDLLEAASRISQLESAMSACENARDMETCTTRAAQEEENKLRQMNLDLQVPVFLNGL